MFPKRRALDNYADLAYAASTSKKLAIPRDRFIQALLMRLTITGDTASSVTANENAAAALINAIRMTKNGDHFVNLPAQDLLRMNQYWFGRVPVNSLTTTVSQTDITLGEAELILPFMLFPKNPMDFRAAIPAHMLASLDLFIDWGAASNLGTGYTVDSAELRVELREVDLTRADVARIRRFFEMFYAYQEKTVSATATDYTFEQDLPVGKILREVFLTVINNSVRSSALVTAYKVRDPDRDLVKHDWYPGLMDDAAEFGFPSANLITGFTSLKLGSIGGIDARRAKAGDVKYKHTNGSPTATAKVRLAYQEVK